MSLELLKRAVKAFMPKPAFGKGLYAYIGEGLQMSELDYGTLAIPQQQQYGLGFVVDAVATWLEEKESDGSGARYYGVDAPGDEEHEYFNLIYVDDEGAQAHLATFTSDDFDPAWDKGSDKFDRHHLKRIIAARFQARELPGPRVLQLEM